MKLRFDRHETSEALRSVCSVAAARSPKPILKAVRLEARADVLLLSATDLELGLRCTVAQVEVEEPGVCLVTAETFARIVGECSDDVLAVETDENLLHVRGEGSHFQVVTQDPAEFPPVPEMTGKPDFCIEGSVLGRLIEWTVFAAARESTRYAINGILWEVDGETLSLAATDGRRLALARGAITQNKLREMVQAIMPGKALSLLRGLPSQADAAVRVKIAPNQVLVDTGRAQLSTSLVEGHFPNYHDVIPSDCDRDVELDTAGFLSALRRAALLTNEESKGVRLSLEPGMLTLSGRAPEQGEATVSMPVKYAGEPLEIGFNPVFLIDVLRVAHAEEVRFSLKEPNRPGVVRVGEDFVYVVMPVNLASA
ncbi:MAG: DNA polymerase III subunit beta [Planctomycetes bacterium]|nr:DNA polymerase III subunit beta [Planctomycetota bacterium]